MASRTDLHAPLNRLTRDSRAFRRWLEDLEPDHVVGITRTMDRCAVSEWLQAELEEVGNCDLIVQTASLAQVAMGVPAIVVQDDETRSEVARNGGMPRWIAAFVRRTDVVKEERNLTAREALDVLDAMDRAEVAP